jgi:hypothetical protein
MASTQKEPYHRESTPPQILEGEEQGGGDSGGTRRSRQEGASHIRGAATTIMAKGYAPAQVIAEWTLINDVHNFTPT